MSENSSSSPMVLKAVSAKISSLSWEERAKDEPWFAVFEQVTKTPVMFSIETEERITGFLDLVLTWAGSKKKVLKCFNCAVDAGFPRSAGSEIMTPCEDARLERGCMVQQRESGIRLAVAGAIPAETTGSYKIYFPLMFACAAECASTIPRGTQTKRYFRLSVHSVMSGLELAHVFLHIRQKPTITPIDGLRPGMTRVLSRVIDVYPSLNPYIYLPALHLTYGLVAELKDINNPERIEKAMVEKKNKYLSAENTRLRKKLKLVQEEMDTLKRNSSVAAYVHPFSAAPQGAYTVTPSHSYTMTSADLEQYDQNGPVTGTALRSEPTNVAEASRVELVTEFEATPTVVGHAMGCVKGDVV